MWSQANQGIGQYGRTFGYVAESGPNAGGYFFTWMPTLEETLASIEPDEIDPPIRLTRRTVEREVRRMWRAESRKESYSLIPAA